MDKTPESLCEPSFRTRRAHKKSRYGCFRCKQRRKKCDERAPQCSRCKDGNFTCEYPFKSPKEPLLTPPSFRAKATPTPSPRSATPIDPWPWPTFDLLTEHHEIELPRSVSLSSTELELFSHYLTHTARSIAYDEDDLYALQVGFPNLAFRSRPLMGSILALAAVSQCHDILSQTSAPNLEDKAKICSLLQLGDKNYRESLRQTQEDIMNTNYYECVVANAPLMVLYASANHSVRIRLAQSCDGKDSCFPGFVPEQSQWISLIRAAHLAYTGLLHTEDELHDKETGHATPRLDSSFISAQNLDSDKGISPEDGPTMGTRRLLLPILETTSGPALERLRSKAQAVFMMETAAMSETHTANDGNNGWSPAEICSPELEACLVALEVLCNTMDEVFRNYPDSTPTNVSSNKRGESNTAQLSHFSDVSPWLRNYLARVTSATQPKPLRRIIPSFLNRVPAEFLSIVQTTTDDIPGQSYEDENPQWIDPSLYGSSATHQLAMDIFAHWLVLVMLLDGVWWIGKTGSWELERVISLMRSRGWLGESHGNWWPESMHTIVTESKKYMMDR